MILGQVGGVAVSSALFQSILNDELRRRIHREDAEQVSSPNRSTPCPQADKHVYEVDY